MLKENIFIVILKFHGLLPETNLKNFLQFQGFVETNLSKEKIKVWTFRGNELDLAFKKAGLESELISQYLTLIDIGLAPEFTAENIAHSNSKLISTGFVNRN